MVSLPAIYQEAQQTCSHEIQQVYLNTAITPSEAVKAITCAETRQVLDEYVDELIDQKHISLHNRENIIEESWAALNEPEKDPILLIVTPRLISAHYKLKIICLPGIFNAPSEAHFQNLVEDNYSFMAKQVFYGFKLPNDRVVNSVSTDYILKADTMKEKDKLNKNSLTDYLYFLGRRNQLWELPKRKIHDDSYRQRIETEARKHLSGFIHLFPRQQELLQLSIENKAKYELLVKDN
jgi:hypothetical protein